MSDEITPEKTHALLEQLAEHVMNKMATKPEMNDHFVHVEANFQQMNSRLTQVEVDLQQTKRNVELILDGMDAQAKQLDIIRIEQAAFSHAIDRHEKRITALEEKDTGWRIRDKKE